MSLSTRISSESIQIIGFTCQPRLREDTDGELLASLKELDGARIRVPDDPRDGPDRAHLEFRFRQFRERR